MKYTYTNGVVLDEYSVIDQDQGMKGQYKYVDINSVGISYHYDLIMSSADVFEEELEAIYIPGDATVTHSNILDIFQLEDPKLFNLHYVPRSQMDRASKYTVTNNLNLLCKVKWYNIWFRFRFQMKCAISEQTIVPEAEGYLHDPTMQEGKFIEILCYFSPKFTSTLLSDNDVLKILKHASEYSGQSMLEFFDETEINDMPEDMQSEI